MISRSCLDTLTELFVILTASTVFPTRTDLCLNDWEISTVISLLLGKPSSLLRCNKCPDVSE